MSTDQEYRARIQALDFATLRGLWEQLKTGEAIPGWGSGRAFEYLILRAFQLDDAVVTWPFSVRLPFTDSADELEQIDGAVRVDGAHYLVESKDEKDDLTVTPIAKLRNQLLRRPAGTLGLVFSRRSFTESAQILSAFTAPQTVLLWTADDLDYAFEHRYFRAGLVAKRRHAAEQGLSNYHLILEGGAQ